MRPLETVRTLFEASGIQVPEEDLAVLAERYPDIRRSADLLYGVRGEVDPAVVFDPRALAPEQPPAL